MTESIDGPALSERIAKQLINDFSVEMTAKDINEIEEAAALLPPATRVSITFLPNEDFPGRIEAAAAVRRAGLTPVPHISARRLTTGDELERFLDGLVTQAHVDHVFIVAGDPPFPAGPYEDALAVIRSGLLGKYGINRVGIAGYPEGHPAIAPVRLSEALQSKQEALASLGIQGEIMTQFAFDADPIAKWLAAIRVQGITLPVRIGVAGPASAKTLLRFAARCGVGTSAKVMRKYGLSLTRLLGTAGPDHLLAELGEQLDQRQHGEVMLHFYPFGGLRKTAAWVSDYAHRY